MQIDAKTDSDGHLRLDVPLCRPSIGLSVLLVWDQNKGVKQYDFSDLAGRLRWCGDAVAVQRELRKEWA